MLRKLGHVTADGIVSLKGRAACEISTGDELLTTELMFNGVFNSLDVHQLVAVVSCLVPVEKSNVRLPNPCANTSLVISSEVSQMRSAGLLGLGMAGTAATAAAKSSLSLHP